jgi:uncharacterized membrane protein
MPRQRRQLFITIAILIITDWPRHFFADIDLLIRIYIAYWPDSRHADVIVLHWPMTAAIDWY